MCCEESIKCKVVATIAKESERLPYLPAVSTKFC
jgi:hypothetical protein